jgi:4-hydroxybenzoate polyprenyltransferase
VFRDLKGFAQFISIERGLMLFMISVGATFLTAKSLAWSNAIYLGLIVFCGWSGVDAINNVFDVDLDVTSDPFRAEYTKKLGKFGLFIATVFSAVSLGLGFITMIPLVILFIMIGIPFGVLYSVPPFRLRKTAYKPLVNFTVGAIPILIVAAFFDIFSVNVVTLALLIGVTTAINSLWEDMADYASDFTNGARTVPIMLGFRRGLFVTLILGYCLIPLMILVGMLFQLHLVYYFVLFALTFFVSLRLYQNRFTLFRSYKTDTKRLLELGEILAKDFVIAAIIYTLSLMLSGYLKISPFLF